MTVTAYGYVMYALEHHGSMCAYNNVFSSDACVKGYVDSARKYKEDMPALLLNAHEYVSKMLVNIPDIDVCLKQLEGMTFPYVLYVLFAGGGNADTVRRYRPEMEEQMRRYPSTLDALPESYRTIGEEVIHADTDEA